MIEKLGHASGFVYKNFPTVKFDLHRGETFINGDICAIAEDLTRSSKVAFGKPKSFQCSKVQTTIPLVLKSKPLYGLNSFLKALKIV